MLSNKEDKYLFETPKSTILPKKWHAGHIVTTLFNDMNL